ncbi:MAG: hypothetical protein LQ345_002982 [Seirophora villosa]|nr:MAG: hypothetical protein LQ345_002982 [Seirophora villosa]
MAPTPKKSTCKRRGTDQEQNDARQLKRKSNVDFMKIIDRFKSDATKFTNNIEKEQDSADSRLIELQQAEIKATRNVANLKALKAENKRLTEQLEAFERKATESTEANEMLKIDLLKQQPAGQLPDSEVVEKYEQLYEAVSAWVNDEVGIFDAVWHHRQFLGDHYRLGGEYLLESLAHQEIHDALLSDRNKFFGLDELERKFLCTVEEGLSKLDPPRNPAAIRYVKSETLKGFSQSELFQRYRAELVPMVGEAILNSVDSMLPGLQDQPDRAQLLCDRVVEPAFDLAIAMKTSATSYGFSSSFTRETRFMKSLVHPHESKSYRMIDVNTRGVIKMGNIDPGDAVERLLLLAPGLVRCNPGMPQKHLTPTIICVKVIHPEAVSSGNSDRGSSDPLTTSPVTVNEPQNQETPQISDELGRSRRVDTVVQPSISKGKLRAEMRNPIINKHLGLTKVVYGTAESDDLTTDGTSHPGAEESEYRLDAKEIAKGEALSQLPARAGKKRMLESPSRAGTFKSDAGVEDDWSRLGKIEED